MYQTVGYNSVEWIAQAMELPIVRRGIKSTAVNQVLHYTRTEEDEVEDLFQLLQDVKVIAITSYRIYSSKSTVNLKRFFLFCLLFHFRPNSRR